MFITNRSILLMRRQFLALIHTSKISAEILLVSNRYLYENIEKRLA